MHFDGGIVDRRVESFWSPDRVFLFPAVARLYPDLERAGRDRCGHLAPHAHALVVCVAVRCFGAFLVVFEGMNEIVQNWHYHLPHSISSTQYFVQATIDFSTVVPAALSASFLSFTIVGRFRVAVIAHIRVKHSHLAILSLLGTLSFSLLALFPQETFPLVWIDPRAHRICDWLSVTAARR